MGKKGTAIDLSMNHKLEIYSEFFLKAAGEFVEDNRVNGVLNLSRSLEDHEYKQDKKLKPEQQVNNFITDEKVEIKTHKEDFMKIACGGVMEMLEYQKVVDFIYSKITPSVKLFQILDNLFEKLFLPILIQLHYGAIISLQF